jgi:hypothetical protein
MQQQAIINTFFIGRQFFRRGKIRKLGDGASCVVLHESGAKMLKMFSLCFYVVEEDCISDAYTLFAKINALFVQINTPIAKSTHLSTLTNL